MHWRSNNTVRLTKSYCSPITVGNWNYRKELCVRYVIGTLQSFECVSFAIAVHSLWECLFSVTGDWRPQQSRPASLQAPLPLLHWRKLQYIGERLKTPCFLDSCVSKAPKNHRPGLHYHINQITTGYGPRVSFVHILYRKTHIWNKWFCEGNHSTAHDIMLYDVFLIFIVWFN